jgi:hypothetical protein
MTATAMVTDRASRVKSLQVAVLRAAKGTHPASTFSVDRQDWDAFRRLGDIED